MLKKQEKETIINDMSLFLPSIMLNQPQFTEEDLKINVFENTFASLLYTEFFAGVNNARIEVQIYKRIDGSCFLTALYRAGDSDLVKNESKEDTNKRYQSLLMRSVYDALDGMKKGEGLSRKVAPKRPLFEIRQWEYKEELVGNRMPLTVHEAHLLALEVFNRNNMYEEFPVDMISIRFPNSLGLRSLLIVSDDKDGLFSHVEVTKDNQEANTSEYLGWELEDSSLDGAYQRLNDLARGILDGQVTADDATELSKMTVSIKRYSKMAKKFMDKNLPLFKGSGRAQINKEERLRKTQLLALAEAYAEGIDIREIMSRDVRFSEEEIESIMNEMGVEGLMFNEKMSALTDKIEQTLKEFDTLSEEFDEEMDE